MKSWFIGLADDAGDVDVVSSSLMVNACSAGGASATIAAVAASLDDVRVFVPTRAAIIGGATADADASRNGT